MNLVKIFKSDTEGQGLVEYGLILALVSVVAVGALGGIGDKVSDTFGVASDVNTDSKIAQGYIPISTVEDLKSISKNETRKFGLGSIWEGDYTSGLDKKYIQVGNIDLVGENFNPIGDSSVEFSGVFDGGDFVICNLKINNGPLSYAGLFGYVKNGKVSSVRLESVDVQGVSFVGGLVGRQEGSSITNSYSTGEISGTGYDIGGLVGASRMGSVVERSYSTGKVKGSVRNVGGLVGYNGYSSDVTDSFSSSDVIVIEDVSGTGGLVGRMNHNSHVRNSYAIGLVKGQVSAGGLVGRNKDSNLVGSYYNKDISGQSDTDKGLGKTTDEMKDPFIYGGWDKSVWKIQEGSYPALML